MKTPKSIHRVAFAYALHMHDRPDAEGDSGNPENQQRDDMPRSEAEVAGRFPHDYRNQNYEQHQAYDVSECVSCVFHLYNFLSIYTLYVPYWALPGESGYM